VMKLLNHLRQPSFVMNVTARWLS